MTTYATLITRDGFRMETILKNIPRVYVLPLRSRIDRLWMTKEENSVCLPKEVLHREFELESKKIITNEYGTTARAIYRER